MKTAQWIMKSPIGPLHLVATDTGLRGIFWKKQDVAVVADYKAHVILRKTVTELEEYFSGERQTFTVPLDLIGTDFQRKVWDQLRKIPYGKTLSYSDIARKIKNDKAVRAVGTANGRNPISIIVPCHRVIAADGTLGGYAGGLPTKTRLLELEKENGLNLAP